MQYNHDSHRYNTNYATIQLTNEGTGKAVINSAREIQSPSGMLKQICWEGCKTDFYNSDGSQLNVNAFTQKTLTAQ